MAALLDIGCIVKAVEAMKLTDSNLRNGCTAGADGRAYRTTFLQVTSIEDKGGGFYVTYKPVKQSEDGVWDWDYRGGMWGCKTLPVLLRGATERHSRFGLQTWEVL